MILRPHLIFVLLRLLESDIYDLLVIGLRVV